MEDFAVSTPADLSASFTPDAGTVDAPGAVDAAETEPVSPDAEGGEVDIEALNDQGTEETEDLTADQTAPEEAATEEEPAAEEAQATEEALPDGVRKGKDRNGKDGLWLTPQRYDQFHGAHKALRELEGIAGEPVTPQMFDTFSRAYWGQEKLYSDLLSGDPQAQGEVLGHFFDEAARAVEEGSVAGDPMANLGETMYAMLREKSPSGYAKVRLKGAQDLIEEMYGEALGKNDKALWDSVGHIAKAVGLPYRKSAEMLTAAAQATDPAASLRKENEKLKEQLSGRSANDQTAQFDTWHTGQRQRVSTAILDGAIMPALTDTQKAWEKLPGGKEAFKDLVVDRLHSKVRETLRSDQRFGERINLLTANARRAASAQKRDAIGAQIEQAYTNRANLAVEAHLPDINKFANLAFKEQNDKAHQRRQAAQKHVAPGGGPAVKRSLVPTKMDEFEDGTPANLAKSLTAMFR